MTRRYVSKVWGDIVLLTSLLILAGVSTVCLVGVVKIIKWAWQGDL